MCTIQNIRSQLPHVTNKLMTAYTSRHKTGLFFIHINRAAIRVNILHIFGYLIIHIDSESTSSSWGLDTACSETCSLPASTNFKSVMMVQISVMQKNDWVIFEEYGQSFLAASLPKSVFCTQTDKQINWKYFYYLMYSNKNMDPVGTSFIFSEGHQPHPELEFSQALWNQAIQIA